MHFQTVAEFGGIDILVSNAAVNPIMGPIFEVSFSEHYVWCTRWLKNTISFVEVDKTY